MQDLIGLFRYPAMIRLDSKKDTLSETREIPMDPEPSECKLIQKK
jgi:hypothetical protein